MKKPLRLLGTMVSLLALTACQDLGSEITEAEAVKQQAKIAEAAEQKAPTTYSFTAKINASVNSNITIAELGGKRSGKETASAYAAYNANKIYGYISMKLEENSTVNGVASKQSGKSEGWVYYKEGALYAVSNQTDEKGNTTKLYSKTTMTEAEAKLRFDSIFVDSYYEEMLDLSGIKSIADALSQAFNVDSYVTGTGIKAESSLKYYSKGDGNLSLASTASASFSDKTGSLKFKSKFTATVDNYMLTNASESLSLSLKDSKSELVGAKISLSIKGSKSCSTSYPNLTGYVESNIVTPEDVAQIDLVTSL